MSEFELYRTIDHSGVSGTGVVAYGCEFPDGSVALRWPGEHPSTAVWEDIRSVEAIHGHNGDTLVRYVGVSDRLLVAYQMVMRFLLNEYTRPITVGPHPDHSDRLRLCFIDEPDWRYWLALLDGSSYAATHHEVAGETLHCWVDPTGSLWLEYSTPLANDNDPLAVFDREDRG